MGEGEWIQIKYWGSYELGWEKQRILGCLSTETVLERKWRHVTLARFSKWTWFWETPASSTARGWREEWYVGIHRGRLEKDRAKVQASREATQHAFSALLSPLFSKARISFISHYTNRRCHAAIKLWQYLIKVKKGGGRRAGKFRQGMGQKLTQGSPLTYWLR